MKQQLLFLMVSFFLSLTTIQSQESLDYKIIESYNSFSDSYSLSEKEEYTYNTNGQLTKAERYFWDSIAWTLSSKNEFVYDPNGNLTELIYANWNSTTNQWDNRFREVSVYTNNLITRQTSYNWVNADWEPEFRTDFNYVNGKIETYNSPDWNGTQWVVNERGIVNYNLDKISETILEEFINNNWELSDKTIYTRNATSGMLEAVIWQTWDGEGWESEDKDDFTVDTNGNRLSETYSESNDGVTWMPHTKIEYTYDNAALISNYYHPFNVESYFFELGVEDFPHHNKVSTSLESEHDGAAWEIDSKTTYYYSDDTMSLIDLSNSNFITIYPNPVKNTLHINLKENAQANANLFDINGRLVLHQKFQALSTSLNIEALDSGMYMLKIFTENGFAVKRITKN